MKQNILAIETSGSACSVALVTGQKQFVRFEPTQKAHTQLLLPMVKALLEEAQLPLKEITHIAVGRGPGSFTGVRIAVSAAQGLAYGLQIPVYPVSTLEALCCQVHERKENRVVIPAIDARMHEIYAAAFICEAGEFTTKVSDCLVKPGDLIHSMDIQQSTIIAIGSGWDVYYDEIIASNTLPIVRMVGCQVNALEVGLIAQAQIQKGEKGVAAIDVLPVYIRDNVAEKSTRDSYRGWIF